MSRRKPPEDNDFHDEMLRHLDENPPPRNEPDAARKPERKPGPAPARKEPARRRDTLPSLMLRGMTVDAALDRLERFLRQHHRHGTHEVRIIVGKGSRSPSGESILAPEIREFCQARPALVRSIRDAPMDQGGSGAWILELENG